MLSRCGLLQGGQRLPTSTLGKTSVCVCVRARESYLTNTPRQSKTHTRAPSEIRCVGVFAAGSLHTRTATRSDLGTTSLSTCPIWKSARLSGEVKRASTLCVSLCGFSESGDGRAGPLFAKVATGVFSLALFVMRKLLFFPESSCKTDRETSII